MMRSNIGSAICPNSKFSKTVRILSILAVDLFVACLMRLSSIKASRLRKTQRLLAPPLLPPPAASPPACDAKTLEKCTPNSGDTAWMLTSVALVLMMTVPGLGLFYGGMVRKKNVGDTVMTSFADYVSRHCAVGRLQLQSRVSCGNSLYRRA